MVNSSGFQENLNLLHWKTNLYEESFRQVNQSCCKEPTDVADQVMMVLDQVSKTKGAKNDKGPSKCLLMISST